MELLCWSRCHNTYQGFQQTELENIALFYGTPPSSLWADKNGNPYDAQQASDCLGFFCTLPSIDIITKIINRSILTRFFVEIFAYSSTIEGLVEELQKPDILFKIKSFINPTTSWKFMVAVHGRRCSQQEQGHFMDKLQFLFKGDEPVNLVSPDITLVVLEENFFDGRPKRMFFGRMVGKQSDSWWKQYDLPLRPILGPTTMDNELAFIMCNLARVGKNMIVFDPFVGTGGILISASHLGAYCIGQDCDIRVIKGYGVSQRNLTLSRFMGNRYPSQKHKEASLQQLKGTDIFQNFSYYSLPFPDVTRGALESSQGCSMRSNWRVNKRRGWIDAIVTDPPYGRRAGARKAEGHSTSSEEPCLRVETDADWAIRDLIEWAGEALVDGGSLVFLVPINLDDKCILNTTSTVKTLLEKYSTVFDLLCFIWCVFPKYLRFEHNLFKNYQQLGGEYYSL